MRNGGIGKDDSACVGDQIQLTEPGESAWAAEGRSQGASDLRSVGRIDTRRDKRRCVEP